ncbi:MAG: hypothetical protein QOH58_3520 [Thermoleophilaceae bacterium]|jgi:uncharacterized protein YbcI|nr:hypothetical protein [Thermoleophilaceae bacterium]
MASEPGFIANNGTHLEFAGSGAGRLTGGPLNAALARAVVQSHRTYFGRGPTKAQAFFCKNLLVVVMEDTLTKGERNLVASGQADAVAGMREQCQHTMQEDLVAQIEQLTGRSVRACLSSNHIEADVAAELFVLDGPV